MIKVFLYDNDVIQEMRDRGEKAEEIFINIAMMAQLETRVRNAGFAVIEIPETGTSWVEFESDAEAIQFKLTHL